MDGARYNRGMRRRTRLGLVIAILLLIAGIGAHTAFWFIAAGKIEDAQAKQALEKALSLAPDRAESHLAAAWIS